MTHRTTTNRTTLALAIALCAIIVSTAGRPTAAQEPFIGQIQYYPYNFAVRWWEFCNGQTLPVSQQTALFSLLGTTFGGDGRTTFALPDMRGRIPIHPGTGPGLTARSAGERGGSEVVSVSIQQFPRHQHALNATTEIGDATSPTAAVPARDGRDQTYTNTAPNTNMHADHILPAGNGNPHDNMPPWLALNCQIALQGVYPPRN